MANSKKIEQKLLDLKDKIEKTKENLTRLQGRMSTQEDALNDLGFDSKEAAQQKLKKLDNEVEKLENEIDDELEKLEERFDA